MTKTELTTIITSIQKRRVQYQQRLNELHRLIREIEGDTVFKEQAFHEYQALLTEATTVHFDYTKHLRHYYPIVKLAKDCLTTDKVISDTLATLLNEHYTMIMSFTETHMRDVEEYTALLAEGYELQLEQL